MSQLNLVADPIKAGPGSTSARSPNRSTTTAGGSSRRWPTATATGFATGWREAPAMTADDFRRSRTDGSSPPPRPWRCTWSTASATSTRRSPTPSDWPVSAAPRSSCSTGPGPGAVDLRHHPEHADPGGDRPVQLSRARPEPDADLPLSLATRPDRVPASGAVTRGGPGRNFTPDLDPDPADWPVLVTGASGFVGGHIARDLARRGHRVRALTRSAPHVEPGDPAIDWVVGDLRIAGDRRRALRGVRGVIHCGELGPPGSRPAGRRGEHQRRGDPRAA